MFVVAIVVLVAALLALLVTRLVALIARLQHGVALARRGRLTDPPASALQRCANWYALCREYGHLDAIAFDAAGHRVRRCRDCGQVTQAEVYGTFPASRW